MGKFPDIRNVDTTLAEEMAYAEKPYRDYLLSDAFGEKVEEDAKADLASGDIARDFPELSEGALAMEAVVQAISLAREESIEAADHASDAVYKRAHRAFWSERVDKQRAKTAHVVSGGLPTLGKRK